MTRLFKTMIVSLWCLFLIVDISTAGTTERPRSGGVLEVALRAKLVHMNSAIASGDTGLLAPQIFATLIRLDHNWEYRPYLAEKWEISPDGLSVTFHLRSGATFHDGKPVTSKDVAFSIRTIQKYHPFSTMLSAVEKVDTPDPLTAVFRLSKPHPALMTALASPYAPILPRHVYGDGRDIKTHPANLKPVGSGPFKFVSFTDQEIVLERYDDFFLPGKPYLDKLVYKILEQPVIPIALETGSVQLYGFGLPTELNKETAKLDNYSIEYGGYEGIGALQWLAFNLRKAPLNDIRVRRAFAYTIDREYLTRNLYDDKAKVATGPISPDSPFYSDKVNTYPVDIELANRLLDEAGFPRNDKGIRFSVSLASRPRFMSGLSEYLQSVLTRKLGVEVKIREFAKLSDWARFVADGEFELAIDGVWNWVDPVIGVHRTYSSSNIRPGVIWSNTQGYSNPVVDELMDRAGSEMDVTRRKALYAEFQKQVVEDLPVYWLYQMPFATTRHRNLEGIKNGSVWGLMFPFTDVYWDNKK